MFAFREKSLADLYWYRYNIVAVTLPRAEIACREGANGAHIGIE